MPGLTVPSVFYLSCWPTFLLREVRQPPQAPPLEKDWRWQGQLSLQLLVSESHCANVLTLGQCVKVFSVPSLSEILVFLIRNACRSGTLNSKKARGRHREPVALLNRTHWCIAPPDVTCAQLQHSKGAVQVRELKNWEREVQRTRMRIPWLKLWDLRVLFLCSRWEENRDSTSPRQVLSTKEASHRNRGTQAARKCRSDIIRKARVCMPRTDNIWLFGCHVLGNISAWEKVWPL